MLIYKNCVIMARELAESLQKYKAIIIFDIIWYEDPLDQEKTFIIQINHFRAHSFVTMTNNENKHTKQSITIWLI